MGLDDKFASDDLALDHSGETLDLSPVQIRTAANHLRPLAIAGRRVVAETMLVPGYDKLHSVGVQNRTPFVCGLFLPGSVILKDRTGIRPWARIEKRNVHEGYNKRRRGNFRPLELIGEPRRLGRAVRFEAGIAAVGGSFSIKHVKNYGEVITFLTK